MAKTPTVGFISAPAWYDPAPSEFPTVVEEVVLTQQAPLPLPDFDYHLESIAAVQKELNCCARILTAAGCNLVAQVGSPFAWAGAASEEAARSRGRNMAEAAQAKAIMTGLAIVDGLRSLGAKKIAVNCTYYESSWRDAFASFLEICGFDIVHLSTLSDQQLTHPNAKMEDYGWSMTEDLTRDSIDRVAQASPDAQAMVVSGAGTRTLAILDDMERRTSRPIIAADTVVYWAIARELDLTLRPVMGTLAGLPRDHISRG